MGVDQGDQMSLIDLLESLQERRERPDPYEHAFRKRPAGILFLAGHMGLQGPGVTIEEARHYVFKQHGRRQ